VDVSSKAELTQLNGRGRVTYLETFSYLVYLKFRGTKFKCHPCQNCLVVEAPVVNPMFDSKEAANLRKLAQYFVLEDVRSRIELWQDIWSFILRYEVYSIAEFCDVQGAKS